MQWSKRQQIYQKLRDIELESVMSRYKSLSLLEWLAVCEVFYRQDQNYKRYLHESLWDTFILVRNTYYYEYQPYIEHYNTELTRIKALNASIQHNQKK